MPRINVLDQNMINMIAAGEVIERPASVVKELVENSIDAGATRVDVFIEDGGRKLISVVDNGCGMDEEDVRRAFEAHATSKIRSSGDLEAIGTLGFRGEALASIASVASVKAVSKTENAAQGYGIEIDCGELVSFAPAAGDRGTKIDVRDLFYKLPARRKFLKTANTEKGYIAEQFMRIALARPDIGLRLFHNGKEVYRLGEGESYLQRIRGLFSGEVADNLLKTESKEKTIRVEAYLGKPCISKTNGKLEYIFLNGRFIKDKFITHAIREAYRGTLEQSRFPVVFLFLEMDRREYDVNVHPTKTEVRFYNSNLVHSVVLGCIREKLLGTRLDTPAQIPDVRERSEKVKSAMEEFFNRYKNMGGTRQPSFSFSQGAKPVKTSFAPQGHVTEPLASERREAAEVRSNADVQRCIQIHDSFIVVETADGLDIIDQHALHERVMYEKLFNRVGQGGLESQKLLIPETIEVSEAEKELLEENAEILGDMGVEIAEFGPNVVAVQSFPTLLQKANAAEFVSDLIGILERRRGDENKEEFLEEVLSMAACKAAIKAGQRLTEVEMRHLLSDGYEIVRGGHCPHGRPTAISFTKEQLDKQFRRT